MATRKHYLVQWQNLMASHFESQVLKFSLFHCHLFPLCKTAFKNSFLTNRKPEDLLARRWLVNRIMAPPSYSSTRLHFNEEFKSRKPRNSRARRPVKILDPGRAAQTVIGRSWTENYKAVTISLKKYFVPFHTSSFFEDMSNQPIKKLFLQFWQSFISWIFFKKYTFSW